MRGAADGDAVGDTAVGDGDKIAAMSNDGSGAHFAVDGAVIDYQVLDGGFFSVAEESDVIFVRLVDVQSADGVPLAVESAGEGVRTIADGREVVLFALVEGDVVAQLEELALKIIAEVDPNGEVFKVCCGTDDVSVILGITAVVQFPVVGDCETDWRRGVVVAVAVAGNGGLHPVGAWCRGLGGGVFAVLRRVVFIGNGSRTEVIADEAGHRCRSLKIIGARHGEAAVRRLGDGGSHGVGIVHRRIAVIALARVVIDGISAGFGGRYTIHHVRIAARSAQAEVHIAGIVAVIVRWDKLMRSAVIGQTADRRRFRIRTVDLGLGVDVHVDVGSSWDTAVQGYIGLV